MNVKKEEQLGLLCGSLEWLVAALAEHMYSWLKSTIKTSSNPYLGHLFGLVRLTSMFRMRILQIISPRVKSGIDTLDASSELLESAKSIDIKNIEANRIRGFLRDGVSFGGATAFRAKFHAKDDSVLCAVLIPDLTRHYDVVEIISAKFLREHFSLVDGDTVSIELL